MVPSLPTTSRDAERVPPVPGLKLTIRSQAAPGASDGQAPAISNSSASELLAVKGPVSVLASLTMCQMRVGPETPTSTPPKPIRLFAVKREEFSGGGGASPDEGGGLPTSLGTNPR